MNLELVALAISVVALLTSARALRGARIAGLQALRTEVRRDLDQGLGEAGQLLDDAVALTEDTMMAASEVSADDGADFRPDEREAFDLREEARQPLAELERINTDLSAASRKQLTAIRDDLARVRRSMDVIRSKIDVKNSALDRVLQRPPGSGRAPHRQPVFRSRSLGQKAGKPGA